MADGPRLELRKATKCFASLVAVDALDVTLEPGQIHAIIGENGAGKSTALKLLAGYLPATRGEVLVGGSPLEPATPQEAMSRGVGMVHQHFMLVERLSALENLVLGHEPRRGLTIDLGRAKREADALAEASHLHVALDQPVERLGVGERQRLEILRVLYRGARAILLDEPTAVLSPIEVGDLYRTLRELADTGATVAVVTHRLDEVARFADEVTVMRRGRRVAFDHASKKDDADAMARLARAVMGGEPAADVARPELEGAADAALELEDVVVEREGRRALDGLSLAVVPGEVVGVAGVEGNGQAELARVLSGLLPLDGGRILLAGREVSSPAFRADGSTRVRNARQAGLVVVHEDRQEDELVLDATVADNLVLGDLGTVDERRAVEARFDRFDIYPPAPGRLVRELSGGNQQKVVMGRALDRRIVAFVAAQPTRGVDVGTARTIQRAIAGVAADGAAVVVISADLHELRALSHRIVVLRKGRIVAQLEPSASDEMIGRAMLGLDERGAA